MILVTGATGNLGSNVVKQLLTKLNDNEFVVSSSTLSGVEKLKNGGLNARLINFNDKEGMVENLKGISKILLVSTMENNRLEQHKNVVDAAAQAGVKHIVYTSLAIQSIENSAVKELMLSHFQTEDYLKQSGITYTILRNTMYADALVQILGENALNQSISLPAGSGKVPFVLRREMGEATANLLLEDGHDSKIYSIVNSESYDFKSVADELSCLTNKKIDYKPVSEQQFTAFLESIGFPPFMVYLHAGTIKDIEQKQYEVEDKTLESLLGRKPATLSMFLNELF